MSQTTKTQLTILKKIISCWLWIFETTSLKMSSVNFENLSTCSISYLSCYIRCSKLHKNLHKFRSAWLNQLNTSDNKKAMKNVLFVRNKKKRKRRFWVPKITMTMCFFFTLFCNAMHVVKACCMLESLGINRKCST